jgi:hypothetical protein
MPPLASPSHGVAGSAYLDRMTAAERVVWEAKHPAVRAKLLEQLPAEYEPAAAARFAAWVRPRSVFRPVSVPDDVRRDLAILETKIAPRPDPSPTGPDRLDSIDRKLDRLLRLVRAALGGSQSRHRLDFGRPRHGPSRVKKTGRRVPLPKCPGGRSRSV